MDKTLLSIITINYNNAQGLQNTINSVLSQPISDYSQIEYIIVDGASTDGSLDIISQTERKTGQLNLKWSSEPDSGIYNAMNKGIGRAEGEYVYMLNSGDFLEANALPTIIEKLQTNPDLLLFEVNLLENCNRFRTELRYPINLRYGSMLHQGMIYKKSLHEKYGLYDEQYKYASDYDFSIKAFYEKDFKLETIYSPCANFLWGGLGESDASFEEIHSIKLKNNFITEKKKSRIKQIIKSIIPYGIITLYNKIKK